MNEEVYDNFINAIKSEETKKNYCRWLTDYKVFCKSKNHTQLLQFKDDKIIDYIMNLRKQKLSYSSINTRVSAVYHFYCMNDVLLNRQKINKYKGEFRTVVKDRAYTREEIHKLLDNADLRMKICILLMASGGLRLGAIPSIKLKHLEGGSDFISSDLGHDSKKSTPPKLTIYENSNEEYYTFITPECASLIKEYINYRRRNGEKVTPEAHLIRNDFNIYQPLKLRQTARAITKHTIREIIAKLLRKSGVRLVGEVSLTHGFRKFFTTQLVNSKVNPEIREMLLGHKIGLASVYYKPTEQEMYSEYEKAINNLTINEENRLKEKIKTLEIEQNKVDKMQNDILDMKKMLGLP
jgi:integrase